MPTYEYGCEACGKHWEMEQRISEDPIKKCPHCKKRRAKRLISGGSGVIFKGGGWYADLYHKPAGGSSDKGESASESSSSDSSDSASTSSSDSSSDKADKPKKTKKAKKASKKD